MIAQPTHLPTDSAQPSTLVSGPASDPKLDSEQDAIDRIFTLFQQLAPAQQQLVLEFVDFLGQKHASQVPEVPVSEPQLPESQESEVTIWQRIREIAANVPDEEWEKIPTDGSYQHDHYLYGMPKREL